MWVIEVEVCSGKEGLAGSKRRTKERSTYHACLRYREKELGEKSACTINQRVSNTVSEKLGRLTEADSESCESTSTEDLLSKVNELNKKIREDKVLSEHLVVGSLDIKVLYPSIFVKQAI